MNKNKFDDVFSVFLKDEIFSFKKYLLKDQDVYIYSFQRKDFRKIFNMNLIDNNISGVYILEDRDNKEIYIGQTINILQRINNHILDSKKVFDYVYLIQNKNLNDNIWKKIEERLINLFKNSIENFNVKNSNENSNFVLSEEDEIHYNRFNKSLKRIMKLFDFNVEEKNKDDSIKNKKFDVEDTKKFIYERKTGEKGVLIIVDNGFKLLKGSKLTKKINNDDWLRGNNKKKKLAYRTRKIIDENNILLEDLFYSTPSTLASLVSGLKAENGYDRFKDNDNKTLNKYLDRR